MRRTILLLMAGALVAGCATAAADLAFDGVDADDNDLVSRAEWSEFLDDVDAFPRYDDDDDGALNREEYREAVDEAIEGEAYFRGYDRDANGRLSRAEFASGLFGTYDADDDGWLNESEFEAAATSLAFEL